ncbi:hypothetical protein KQI65_16660 [bacterium]|nr:hypothetical protein [bacterium]
MRTHPGILTAVLILLLIAPTLQAQDETTSDILRNEEWISTGPAVGPIVTWHNFRQDKSGVDILPGVYATYDLMLAQPFPRWYITFRPSVSILYPTAMIDAVFRFRLPIPFAFFGGASFDPTWTREFAEDPNHPEFQYDRILSTIGQRSFGLIGAQYVTSFAFYELQYRIQLEEGVDAYYRKDEASPLSYTGTRRYFLLSFGMGIRL